jgi:hypothetical protein
MMYSLDQSITGVLPELQHNILHRSESGQLVPVECRSWKILSSYFRPMPETAVGATKSELWGNRRLSSALGGWVDYMAAIAPGEAGAATAAAPKDSSATANLGGSGGGENNVAASANTVGALSAPSGSTAGAATTEDTRTADGIAALPGAIRRSRMQPFHYLDPSIELYREMDADAQKLQTELAAAHYPMTAAAAGRLNDFVRLLQRLEKISILELRGQPVSAVDRKLLGEIDEILENVDTPLPTTIAFESPAHVLNAGTPDQVTLPGGFNMANGRPGLLYIIYQNPQTMQWTLGRGAVYTYYETPAPLMTNSMWEHKVEAGFAKPPAWTAKYEIVQQSTERKNATAAVGATATH